MWSCLIIGAAFAGVQQPLIRTWQADDGLPQNVVNDIVQDERGYLWLGTAAGVVRFDGRTFTDFTSSNHPGLAGDRISSLMVAHDGRMWVGTDQGVSVLSDGEFRKMSDVRKVEQLAESADGTVWAATLGSGIHSYPQQPVVDDPRLQRCSAITIAPSGATWFGCPDFGAAWTTPGDDEVHLVAMQRGGSFSRLLPLDDGRVLLATTDGLEIFDNDKTEAVDLGDVGSVRVASVERAPDGRIWVGTGARGVLVLTDDLQPMGFVPGTEAYSILAIHHEPGGTAWLGTAGGGLMRVMNSRVSVLDRGGGRTHGSTVAVFEDSDGGVWSSAARCDGATRTVDGTVEHMIMGDEFGMPFSCIWSFEEQPAGVIWVGTWDDGVARFDRRTRRFIDSIVPASGTRTALALHSDSQGRMWVGTDLGVERWNGHSLVPVDGIPAVDVRAIFEDDDGSMWFGTTTGLFHLGTDGVAHFEGAHGLRSPVVRDIERVDGSLLVATYGAGLHLQHSSGFRQLGADHGLSDDFLSHIFDGPGGYVWLSGNAGLQRFPQADLRGLARGEVARLSAATMTRDHGLPDSECNGGSQSSGVLSDGGSLLVPTMGGVAIVDALAVSRGVSEPPVVHIETMELPGRTLVFPSGEIILEPHERQVELTFTGITYDAPEQVRYRYRSDGQPWRVVSGRRLVFSGLAPGHHHIEIQARIGDGSWSESASVSLEAVPLLKERAWFRVLTFGPVPTLFLLVALYYRKREEIVQRRVDARTAELAEANRRLQSLANVDTLTGVYSRRYFEEALRLHWLAGVRPGSPLGLLMIDVDHFKRFNDRHGHVGGDMALRAVGEVLRDALVRQEDVAARYGGEEFAVLMPNTDQRGAQAVARRVMEAIRNVRIDLLEHDAVNITVSIGVAVRVPGEDSQPHTLVLAADAALYEAKRAGRDRVSTG